MIIVTVVLLLIILVTAASLLAETEAVYKQPAGTEAVLPQSSFCCIPSAAEGLWLTAVQVWMGYNLEVHCRHVLGTS